jgi:biotin transport system substrate-specific component
VTAGLPGGAPSLFAEDRLTSFARNAPLGVAFLPARGPLANGLVRDLVLIAGAVFGLSLLAQVSFNVPFSADRTGQLVPITGQTFGVLLIGVTLGARRGVTAVLAYLAIGLLGAPIYASGASGGVLFTGATAGYLWGFLVAVLFIGWCADRGLDRGPWLYAVLLTGNALIYAVGLPVLALWLDRHAIPVGTLDAGLWPFIPGDLLKLMAVSMLTPSAWALMGRRAR